MTEKTCNSCIHFGACSKWTDFPKQCGVPVCASFAQQSDIERLSAIILKLKQENLLPVHSMIKNARLQDARDIFKEIEKLHLHITNEFDLRRYEELKKKYTEEKSYE